jgi:hypothetical protein
VRSLSLAVQPDGKTLAGGDFTTIGGQARHDIARLDAVSGMAESFSSNANSLVTSIAVQTNGKVLAGGNFSTIGGQMHGRFARLESDGGVDQTLGSFVSIVPSPAAAGDAGNFSYDDAAAVGQTRRFYRLSFP